jgi:hypothetical protein
VAVGFPFAAAAGMARASRRATAGNRLAIFLEIFMRLSLLLSELSVSSPKFLRRQNLIVAGRFHVRLNKSNPSMLWILAALLECHY